MTPPSVVLWSLPAIATNIYIYILEIMNQQATVVFVIHVGLSENVGLHNITFTRCKERA